MILCNYLLVFTMMIQTILNYIFEKQKQKISLFLVTLSSIITLLMTITIDLKLKKYSKM